MFGLYAWIYEQESQRTSERIKTVFRTQAQKGKFKGSIPPYGYTVEEGNLYIRNGESPDVVRRIYRLYLEGKGFDSIARTLTREGFPTPAQVASKSNSGLYWHGTTIKKMLTNPHYTGDLVLCRETTLSVTNKVRQQVAKDAQVIIPNAHASIVSREDFEAVQRHMESRKKKRPKCKKHLFTNVAYCADCGQSLWYLKNRKGYVCGTHRRHGKHVCSQHTIKEDALKAIILGDIRSWTESLNQKEVIAEINSNIEQLQVKKSALSTAEQSKGIDVKITRMKEELRYGGS